VVLFPIPIGFSALWWIAGVFVDRHPHRHQEKGLGKRFSRYRDGDDAHDGPLRAYSRAICEKAAPLPMLGYKATGFGLQGTPRRNIVAAASET
jgi:hypothetical protein